MSAFGLDGKTLPNYDMFQERKLGNNELFCNLCHSYGNLNVMCGLTLLTRHAIDEGLMRCALQEFQHMHPQLTARIRQKEHGKLYFVPMECPILPLDSDFKYQDMLHSKFDIRNGPLWRVQLITEVTMDKAALGFGPELQAIINDNSPVETRWRYFLRYFQGNVNCRDVEPIDDDVEGFRCFILMTFHPSITDTLGSFHLLRQFLSILDSVMEKDEGHRVSSPPSEELHQPIEKLIPANESSVRLTDFPTFCKTAYSFVVPRKSPFEELHLVEPNAEGTTEVLRGRLDEEQTTELLAMMSEDDASLHGTLLAAALIAESRVLQQSSPNAENGRRSEYPPSGSMNLRATNEANLRVYCESNISPRHGSLTTYYEENYDVPPVMDRAEFWRFAHELSVRHNAAKARKEPLKQLRIYNKMFSISGDNALKDMDKNFDLQNDLGVAVFDDLGGLFRREQQAPNLANQSNEQSWNRPLDKTQRNIRLEDVFHVVAAQNMRSPLTHKAHILYRKLNYIMSFHSTYIQQSVAFKVRDEVLAVLRMATEKPS